LVDCHQSMFQPNPNNTDGSDANSPSSIDCVLKAALSFMKTKIITSDNDKIGIVLYGCNNTDNSLNFKNISVVRKLDVPDAATIKDFQSKLDSFETNYGFAAKGAQSALFEALWICHQEFKSVEK